MAGNELVDQGSGAPQKRGSKSIQFWIIFVVVSLPLVFFGTFFFILMVEKPVNMATNQISPDSLAIVMADSIARAKTDSIMASMDSTSTDSILSSMNVEMQGETSGSTFALEAAELSSGQEQSPEETRQTDYRQLAQIYSQMETNAAARIMSNLDDAMVVGILQEMRDRNAADLLTALEPDRAARLSEQLSLAQANN